MKARATAKYVLISPYKARLVIDLIRGKKVDEALNILQFTPKKAARIIKKVLESAIANAENNYGMDVDKLYVVEAYVNEGPRLKRIWPRAWGRASRILRRMSHITVAVEEKIEEKKKKGR
ncbi:MAG: 50S ribosomal protein L22 [Thermodesulfobacteriota bacterium]|nr:50S ribosomal protein L22 [Thermodesulfobacteriota bacterium]MCU4138757.1 Ribosomal protein L22 [Thermodesulfobacteriota bacterium]RKX63878.1 MAG: 50S ribosomal protein L22 [Thermodesulfobacteriota bacterium]HEA83976.1 50S ribosomal protein L22 [Thermodesulfobacterium geofontis]